MLVCPICKNDLKLKNKSYICENSHCFDVSKKGYVNLLLSQSSYKTHGDDKLMSIGRREFLNRGYYQSLLKQVAIKTKGKTNIIDIGCGEGYYTCGIKTYNKDENLKIIGIDISKDIVSAAASRLKNIDVLLAVANCSKLPIADKSCDCIISIFAPITDSEVFRIASDDAIIIRVTPGKEHLYELKKAVYDNPIYNQPINMKINGFEITSEEVLKYTFTASNSDIKNLFMMTPYYYKTSPKDKSKLDEIESLEITAEFVISIYKKITV